MNAIGGDTNRIAEDVDRIGEDVDRIAGDVDRIVEDVDRIVEDVDRIAEDVDRIGEDVDCVGDTRGRYDCLSSLEERRSAKSPLLEDFTSSGIRGFWVWDPKNKPTRNRKSRGVKLGVPTKMNSVPKAFRGNDRTISDIQRLFQWSLILAVLSLGGCAVTNKLTSGLKANSERIQCTITLKRTERQMVVEGVANGSHYSRPVTLRFNAVELAGCFFGKFSTNTGSNGALSLKPKGKAKWRLDLIVERVTSKREEQALHDLHGIYVGIVKSDGTLVLKRLPKRSDRRSAQAD